MDAARVLILQSIGAGRATRSFLTHVYSRRRVGPLVVSIAVGACSGTIPKVPTRAHHTGTPVFLDAPPPPAKVEEVPSPIGDACRWRDGRWEWLGHHWEWQRGAWVTPPPSCYYAPSAMAWTESTGRGLLLYWSGRWYPESGQGQCPDEAPCATRPRTGETLDTTPH